MTATGFVTEQVATGFQMPVNIEFVTNPRSEPTAPLYYVVELYGSIQVILRNGEIRTYAENLLNYNPTGEFPGAGEQGLGDIAYDPTTGDLYLTLLYSSNPADDGAPKYPAIDRLVSTDGGLTLASRTRILDMPGETQGQSHYISNITFGPDRTLWVHVGDGFTPETARDLGSFRGKIPRITTDGAPLTDNPFYTADGVNSPRDYVWSLGVRNPFGGAWRLSDGRHYFVENGPNVDRFGLAVRGRDFGYDAAMNP